MESFASEIKINEPSAQMMSSIGTDDRNSGLHIHLTSGFIQAKDLDLGFCR